MFEVYLQMSRKHLAALLKRISVLDPYQPFHFKYRFLPGYGRFAQRSMLFSITVSAYYKLLCEPIVITFHGGTSVAYVHP